MFYGYIWGDAEGWALTSGWKGSLHDDIFFFSNLFSMKKQSRAKSFLYYCGKNDFFNVLQKLTYFNKYKQYGNF